MKTRVTWMSRHTPTQEQVAELENLLGNCKIEQVNDVINSENDVIKRAKHGEILVVVLPSVMAATLATVWAHNPGLSELGNVWLPASKPAPASEGEPRRFVHNGFYLLNGTAVLQPYRMFVTSSKMKEERREVNKMKEIKDVKEELHVTHSNDVSITFSRNGCSYTLLVNPQNRDQFSIRVSYGELDPPWSYSGGKERNIYPSIRVSRKKSLSKIIKEIDTRLAPKAAPLYQEAKERTKERTQRQERVAASKERIIKEIPACCESTYSEERLLVRLPGDKTHVRHLNVREQCADIEIRRVSIDQLIDILRILT